MSLLEIKDLKTKAQDKEILKGLELKINKGEIHVIMGPNGAGKSTLANTILHNPEYEISNGSILLDGEDISTLKTDEIARKGVFMSFQMPEEIPGISVLNFIKYAKAKINGETPNYFEFREEVTNNMKELDFKESYVSRNMNVGFSGGEKKKNEILQMKFLRPKYIILDELDSGLDVDSLRIVCDNIRDYMKENKEASLLIITHYPRILEYLKPDYVHILKDGSIKQSGGMELALKIEKDGYSGINVVSGGEDNE